MGAIDESVMDEDEDELDLEAVCRDERCPREEVHAAHPHQELRGRPRVCRGCGLQQTQTRGLCVKCGVHPERQGA